MDKQLGVMNNNAKRSLGLAHEEEPTKAVDPASRPISFKTFNRK